MKFKIGFIGCGNMAQAIIGGLTGNAGIESSSIIAADPNSNALDKVSNERGIPTTTENNEVAENSEVIFLAVKPQYYETVISGIKDRLSADQLIITIAPGKTLSWLAERLGSDKKIVRTMPNTPALVGAGITGVCRNSNVSDDDYKYALSLIGSFGLAEDVPESLMD